MFALPSGALLAVGAVAFAVLLAEGAINDWSAVYLSASRRRPGERRGGLGAFLARDGVGRLAGDHLAEGSARARLVRGGMLLGAAGFAAAAAARRRSRDARLRGLGLGLAAVYPLAMRGAAGCPASAAVAIAAVTTPGYVGFLAGPPLVGSRHRRLAARVARRGRRAAVPGRGGDHGRHPAGNSHRASPASEVVKRTLKECPCCASSERSPPPRPSVSRWRSSRRRPPRRRPSPVKNNSFSPTTVSVKKGGKVVWKWTQGGVPHNVTPANGSPGSKTSSKKGYTFTKTFPKAGTFKYVCTLHSSMKMTVKVS